MNSASYSTCLQKQQQMIDLFAVCPTLEAKYERLIELGKEQKPLDPQYKVAENLVHGCQSQTYLRSYLQEGLLMFEAESDALISQGLAALLIRVYSGETPEAVLKCLPVYLEKLDIASSLTLNRANGLESMHLRMKQEALNCLTQNS